MTKRPSTRDAGFRRNCFRVAIGAMLPATVILAAAPMPEALPPDAPVDLRIESLIDEFEHRDEREAKRQREAQKAKRRADVERLGTMPTDEALAFGRRAAAEDPANYRLRLKLIDVLHQAGYSEEAERTSAAIIDEPKNADNALPRQRAMLKRARIAYDRRDLRMARYWLGEVAGGDASGQFGASIEKVGERIIRTERKASMQAAIDTLGTEPTPAALEFGRAAVAQDPENLGLRTRLITLLGRSGRYEEADRMAAAFTADPLTQAEPYKRREMLLERARLALARKDIDAAERFADQATALPVDIAEQKLSTPPVNPVPGDEGDELDVEPSLAESAVPEDPELEQRVQRKQRHVRTLIRIARIGTVPTPEAIAAARALHESEPASTEATFHYASLLSTAHDYARAETVYRGFRATVPAQDAETLARIDTRLSELRIEAAVDAIGDEASPQAIADARALYESAPGSSEAAFHYAELLAANHEYAQAETVYSGFRATIPADDTAALVRLDRRLSDLRIAAALYKIGDEPTGRALAEARTLYSQEPQRAEVGLHYAQLLRKHRDFEESEAVYLEVAHGPGATDADDAVRAHLGIAEIYLAQGRAKDASMTVASLDTAGLSPGTASRVTTVGRRIDERMPAPRFDGHLAMSAGYDSNAVSRTNTLDEDELESFDEVQSPFETLEGTATYQHPLGLNGNYLAVNLRGEHTAYNDKEASSVDRTVVGASIAPTLALPEHDLWLSAGAGYRYRARDNSFSRRTGSVFLRADGYASMRTRLTAGYAFERSEDVRPDRDGDAHEVSLRARYQVTKSGNVQAFARARDETADADYQSRKAFSALVGYQHEVRQMLARTYYWQANVIFDHLRYDAPDPFSTEPEVARRDDSWQLETIVGVRFTEHWIGEVRAGYLDRSSTAERYEGDSIRGYATARYEF